MRRRVVVLACVVVGISFIPYAIGWAVQTDDQVFGGFIVDIEDSNSYLAVMRQGMEGNWRFISLYTPEPQRGVWMYTFYILLGRLVRWSGLSLLAVYHGARAVSSLFLLASVYYFACLCFRSRSVCWNAFLLAGLSSGLGWLTEMMWPTAQGGVSPLDFWLLDAYTFLGILTFPHFALAWAMLLVAFGSALAYHTTARSCYLVWGGGAAFVATSLHPTLSLVMGTTLAAYGLLLWVIERRFPLRWTIGGIPVVLGAGVMTAYLWFAFHSDPVLESWSQSIMATPALYHFLSGYGLLIPLACLGTFQVSRCRDRHGAFLVVWIIASFFLAYIPFSLQRRLLEGVHLPISLLAAVGLRQLLVMLAQTRIVRKIARLGYPRRRTLWLARSLLIALMSLSNLYMVGSASVAAWQRSSQMFHPRDQLDAFEWLGDHLVKGDVILASYDTGNLIPAWTGHRVFLGHWAESVDSNERKRLVADFFTAKTSDSWRQGLLRQHGISYVFFGRHERALGGFDPTSASYLREVYAADRVVVYEVVSQLET